jgi:hypothetical protein
MHLKVGDFMKWLKKLFKKNRQLKIEPVPPMPSWDTIVELLYDKNLDSFCDEVINVLYSKDNSRRYVVLKDEKDIFTYQLEAIYQLTWETFLAHKRWHSRMKAWNLTLTKALIADATIIYQKDA